MDRIIVVRNPNNRRTAGHYNRQHSAPYASKPRPRGFVGTDKIAMITFNDKAYLYAKPADPFSPELEDRVQQLHRYISGSGTNIAAGLAGGLYLIEQSDASVLRRIWLLTDGLENLDQGKALQLARKAYELRCNINTVLFGDPDCANAPLLKQIAEATHRGQFYTVQHIRDLRKALLGQRHQSARRPHRAELTVFAIDTSGSMLTQRMDGRPKIYAVQETLTSLLEYKRQVWS